MKRKRRHNEIVCMCTTYDHPHRLGGGACTGADWCAAFRLIDSYECQRCGRLNTDGSCDVVTGLEPIDMLYCSCCYDECRTRRLEDDYGYLPLDIEEYWEKQQREYYRQ